MKMNLLDRAIGVFSPRRAIIRGVQREYLANVAKRGYEGASSGRRTGAWRGGGSSADAQIASAGVLLRERMRELVRNNPHAAKAVSVLTTHIVGDGIWPRAKTGDAKLDEKIDKLFMKWAKRCDAEGQLDFAGMQTLAVREMVEAGEVLIRRRTRAKGSGTKVPLQLQILEADHIDSAKDGPLSGSAPPAVTVQGIEFNSFGARTAYWLFPVHPGAVSTMASISPVKVSADDVCHLYEKQRTQARGTPWGSPVLAKLRDLGDYADAELMRKKIESCFVGVVINGDEDDLGVGIKVPAPRGAPGDPPPSPDAGVYDASGAIVERFEPGMFAYARGGKDIKFNSPAQTGSYPEFKRVELHEVAAGFRIPYELLSTDLKEVSFISGRLGLLEFHRLVSAVQWQVVIPMFLQPVWEWFIEAAYLAGEIKLDEVPVEWSPPRWSTLDPLAEAKADLLALRTGTRTLPEIIAEKGRDWVTVLGEIEATNKALDAAGIILDSDPRKVSSTGIMQMIAEPADPAVPKPAAASAPPK